MTRHGSLKLTKIVVMVLTAAFLLWELFAGFTPEPNDWLSSAVWSWVDKSPLLPFVLGALASHFVWFRKVREVPETTKQLLRSLHQQVLFFSAAVIVKAPQLKDEPEVSTAWTDLKDSLDAVEKAVGY